MTVTVHIERLVIDAGILGDASPRSVQRAVETALATQLAVPGAARQLAASGHVPSVRATLPSAAGPLGTRIAMGMAGSIGLRATGELRRG